MFLFQAISIALVFALAYLLLVRFVRFRLINPQIANELKGLLKEMNEARKKMLETKSEKWSDKHIELQLKAAHKMNQMSIQQIRLVLVLMVIFFGFMWILSHLDPAKKDDIVITIQKTTRQVSVEIPSGARCGLWYAWVEEKGWFLGKHQLSLPFYVCHKVGGEVWRVVPRDLNVSYREVVQPGEQMVFNFSRPLSVERVVLDNGTRVYLDLPFRIPFLNIKRIYDLRGLFLLFIIVGGFIINPILDRFFNMGGVNGAQKGQN